MFADYYDCFNSRTNQTRADIGDEKYKRVLNYIDGDANKISRVDLKEHKEKYAKGILKPRKITKAEQNSFGVDIPAEMDGGNRIKNVQKKYDKEIEAEFIHRRIEHEGPYNKLPMKEKVNLLRISEMKNLVAQGKAQDGIQSRDVKYIVPQSAEMIALITRINRNE